MKILWTLAALAALGVAGGAAFVWSGLYDISATDQHLAPTYWLLDTAMRRSIKRRADDIAVPDLQNPARIERGLALYRHHCEQCHGAPGVAPQPFALGLTPVPVPLVHTARAWPPAEMFWVVKEGIKMTGMPAWKYRLNDEEIWSVVAFLPAMARLTPQEYAGMKAPAHHHADSPGAGGARPDAQRGQRAIQQYACVTCHAIPGIVGPNAPVGPPLGGIASRSLLGGVLPNNPENMTQWLREPRRFAPHTAMPDLGVTERDARDIAAYLATLK
jgi:mono/diheme cytochrome c family protein